MYFLFALRLKHEIVISSELQQSDTIMKNTPETNEKVKLIDKTS